MIQLTDAISLISTKQPTKDTYIGIGKKIEFLVGSKKFTGTVVTLDYEIANVQYRPLTVDINLSLIDVTLSSKDD